LSLRAFNIEANTVKHNNYEPPLSFRQPDTSVTVSGSRLPQSLRTLDSLLKSYPNDINNSTLLWETNTLVCSVSFAIFFCQLTISEANIRLGANKLGPTIRSDGSCPRHCCRTRRTWRCTIQRRTFLYIYSILCDNAHYIMACVAQPKRQPIPTFVRRRNPTHR